MAGDNSVVLASDSRFSSLDTGPYLLGEHKRCIIHVGKRCLVGCYGLESDSNLVLEHLRTSITDYYLSDEDDSSTTIHPSIVARLISNFLYKSSLMCSPIVIGLSSDNQPYICAMDGLGAMTVSKEYSVIGTATSSVYSLCESLYRPNLSAEELLVMVEKILKSALKRDVLSGGKVNILTVTNDGIFAKDFLTDDV